MAVNEVIYNGETLIDLTSDSVTPETLAKGTTAHDASGAIITGTMTAVQYGKAQALTEEQKTQARENIGAISQNQGSENVGKILVVGTDGNLTLIDMPEGGASGDVTGILDESNNILLSGNLADGTYTLKYENEDGTYIEVGSLVVGEIEEPESTYVNLIPTLTDIDLTTIYNEVGYKENVRISVSNVSTSNPSGEKTQTGTTLLGIMPLGDDGDVLYLRGAKFWDNTGGGTYSGLIWYYDASGTLLNTGTINAANFGLISTDANGDATFRLKHSQMQLIDGTAYIRLNITNPTGELIMTRNQLITD